MLFKLVSLANKLDKLGLYKEADILDIILYKVADKNSLIRALKEDDAMAAKRALTGMSGEDLGLTHGEFQDLTGWVDAASKGDEATHREAMDNARNLLGVGKNIKLNPLTHSPLTGQPWSSGPAPKTNDQLYKELLRLKSIIEPHRGAAAGRYFVDINPPEDYVSVDAGLAFKPEDLVKELEQAGYKKHIPDGETASRSKMVGKDRIVIDVDIAGYAVPTDISISPMTEENFNAVTKVFGPVTTLIQTSLGPKRKDSTFEEAVEEFQHYMSQPGP